MDKLNIPIDIDLNETNHLPTNEKSKAPGISITPEDLQLPDELKEQLPPLVRDYLKYSSPLSDVPDEFLLTPFLAVAGSLIGNKRFIQLGGITVYPVVWTVLFAGSSTLRKSTGLSMAKKPFIKILERWNDEHEMKLSQWRRDKMEAEQNKEPFDTPEPKKNTLYSSDSFSDLTFWEDLAHRGSLTSTPGEFTALWSELTRPRNSMKDLALSIFDAEDSIRRNTKSGGDIELKNPVWNIASATTLENFQRTLTATERSSGLLQRIIPICMEQRNKEFKALTELAEPNKELYSHISEQLQNLVHIEQQPVTLSSSANQTFTAWSHELHNKAEKLESRINDIGGYLSRLNIYGLKFALIFQTLENPSQPISGKNMNASIILCEWLLTHIIYMLERNYIFNRHYADRVKIRELLEKNGGLMNRSHLMNLSHMDKEQLDRALDNEIEAGYIEKVETPTAGRPVREYKYKGGA